MGEKAIDELTFIENRLKKEKEWLKERDRANKYKEECVGKTFCSIETLMSSSYVHVFDENFYVEVCINTRTGNSVKFWKNHFNPNILSYYKKWHECDEKKFWEAFEVCQSSFEDVLKLKEDAD